MGGPGKRSGIFACPPFIYVMLALQGLVEEKIKTRGPGKKCRNPALLPVPIAILLSQYTQNTAKHVRNFILSENLPAMLLQHMA